jgi:hypothetical protein
MAQLSLGEPKWRMLRRALRKKRFRFGDCRNQRRNDQKDFDWLVAGGMFVEVGAGLYELTDKGKVSADLGFYDWEPARPAEPAGRGKKSR